MNRSFYVSCIHVECFSLFERIFFSCFMNSNVAVAFSLAFAVSDTLCLAATSVGIAQGRALTFLYTCATEGCAFAAVPVFHSEAVGQAEGLGVETKTAVQTRSMKPAVQRWQMKPGVQRRCGRLCNYSLKERTKVQSVTIAHTSSNHK
jgi:hypothetical protein